MKAFRLYLALLLSLSYLSAFAGTHNSGILNLEDLTSIGEKAEGCNAGGIYKDSSGSKYFIKTPGYKALPAHEYIVGKLLTLVDTECFAKTYLVEGYPDQVASKFLEGFISYRGHGIRNAGQLNERATTTGMELLLVVKNWLGIEDENPGNVGTVPWDNNSTLHFTRIDYDTAFYFDTYEQRPLNFKTRGINTLDEDALIDALELIAKMPEDKLSETLVEIYANLDHVGVHYNSDQRARLEAFLSSRQKTFEQYYRGFLANREILNLIEKGHFDLAKDMYLAEDLEVQAVIQREWLLDHYTRTRDTYLRFLGDFATILDKSEWLADRNGYTPLHMAIKWRNAGLTKRILESSNNKLRVISAQDNYGWTPLHLAAHEGGCEEIRQILEYSRKSLDLQTHDGKTPLYLAAEKNQAEATSILIEADSNLEAVDIHGNTPLLGASQGGATQTALKLIQAKANVLHMNDIGETALHGSARSNAEEIVNALIDLEPNLTSIENAHGATALHAAIIEGNSTIASNLIRRGANPCAKVEEINAIELAMILSLDLEIFGDNIICF